RLRVKAVTRANLESSAETEVIAVRVQRKGNVVQARALYDRARVLHAQQRVTEARLKYQEALAAWPDFAEVYNDLGKLHAEQREPAKALEYFIRSRKKYSRAFAGSRCSAWSLPGRCRPPRSRATRRA